MSFYRKKPVTIQAEQYIPGQELSQEFLDQIRRDGMHEDRLYIRTLEGQMWLTAGDWIIKGVKGEFYPCKPDIFELTYEEDLS